MARAGWVSHCLHHFVSNFNRRFKDPTLKNFLGMMCRETSKRKFNTLYSQNNWWGPTNQKMARTWTKGKIDTFIWWGHRYGNMITSMSKVLNSILKDGCALPGTALIQLTFYRSNKYFSHQRAQTQDFISRHLLWPLQVLCEIRKGSKKSRSHRTILFDAEIWCFEVNILCKPGVLRVIRHTVNIKEGSCTCGKWKIFHQPCSHLLACCKALRVDYAQFVDPFYSVDMYQNSYVPLFHHVPDKSLWNEYNRP
jgi:hypothetical protein